MIRVALTQAPPASLQLSTVQASLSSQVFGLPPVHAGGVAALFGVGGFVFSDTPKNGVAVVVNGEQGADVWLRDLMALGGHPGISAT